MKILSVALLLISSCAFGMQQESFDKKIKKSMSTFYNTLGTIRSFSDSQQIRPIAYDQLKIDIEQIKKECAKDLLYTNNWAPVYASCKQIPRDAYDHDLAESLRLIETDLINFCNQIRETQAFLKTYAPEKLN